jgi:hypothetical protein
MRDGSCCDSSLSYITLMTAVYLLIVYYYYYYYYYYYEMGMACGTNGGEERI